MASAATQHPQKKRWGELYEDDDGLDYLLPPPVVIGPDKKGIKKVIEYRFDEESNSRVKVTTTKRVLRIARTRVSKGAIDDRRSWPKFGHALKEDAGSSCLTVVSTEVIRIEAPRARGGKADDTTPDKPLLNANNKLMVCRICLKKGDHWTIKCSYKDLAPPTEIFADRPSDGSKTSGDARKRAYVPPAHREGASRSGGGADVMKRRNDENTVRVNNLSEDTTEPDLRELFGAVGRVTRAYIAVDRKTGASRGFGFVNFEHRQDAEEAIRRLHGHGYDNLILRVEWAHPRRPK